MCNELPTNTAQGLKISEYPGRIFPPVGDDHHHNMYLFHHDLANF